MLREEVVQAVAEGKFHIWPVTTVDEGIEILTGMPAGVRGEDGAYPEDTVNGRVDRRLFDLAQRLQRFGQSGSNGREKGGPQGEPEAKP